jgi:hypothetical protein
MQSYFAVMSVEHMRELRDALNSIVQWDDRNRSRYPGEEWPVSHYILVLQSEGESSRVLLVNEDAEISDPEVVVKVEQVDSYANI